MLKYEYREHIHSSNIEYIYKSNKDGHLIRQISEKKSNKIHINTNASFYNKFSDICKVYY